MIKKDFILKFQIFSIIFTWILGTLLHFTYEWSNNNLLLSAFSAVNESTWEHLKLVFFPMLITTIIGYFYIGRNNIQNFLCAKTIGIITSMLFIVIFFYTYNGILGTNFAILDIGSFFVSIVLGEYVANKIIISNFECNKSIPIISLIILLLCFVVFTYFPPKIGLFKDPITNSYGITRIN